MTTESETDAWRAKWGNLTREQAEQVAAQCRESRDAQEACTHHWHELHGTRSSTLTHGPNTHYARVCCCHCGVWASQEWRDEPYTPDGCGRWHFAYRPSPLTISAIEYTTVPTIDP